MAHISAIRSEWSKALAGRSMKGRKVASICARLLRKVAAVAHAHAVLLVDGHAGLHAEQHIMRAAVLFAHIVHVVGGDQVDAELFRPGDEHLVDLHQFRDRVFLQLDEKFSLPKMSTYQPSRS
jgi:hypothetical protein